MIGALIIALWGKLDKPESFYATILGGLFGKCGYLENGDFGMSSVGPRDAGVTCVSKLPSNKIQDGKIDMVLEAISLPEALAISSSIAPFTTSEKTTTSPVPTWTFVDEG